MAKHLTDTEIFKKWPILAFGAMVCGMDCPVGEGS